jgi:fumarate hydratase subunit beta
LEKISLATPLKDSDLCKLKAGDMVYINGDIYTGRDAAHKRMYDMLKNGEEMPFPFEGQIIYYAGPCPNKPGAIIGSVGPTTSTRMDLYSPRLIEHGLKIMIGKGRRNEEVIAAIKKHGGIYFAAIGGAAALMSKRVKKSELIAFCDLGTEAIRKLYVEDFPVIVVCDTNGNCVY